MIASLCGDVTIFLKYVPKQSKLSREQWKRENNVD